MPFDANDVPKLTDDVLVAILEKHFTATETYELLPPGRIVRLAATLAQEGSLLVLGELVQRAGRLEAQEGREGRQTPLLRKE